MKQPPLAPAVRNRCRSPALKEAKPGTDTRRGTPGFAAAQPGLRICFALTLALAGWTMGPDYVRPKVDSPAAFRFEPKAVAETANTTWWKQFGDPVLDQLIDTALANNLNVKIAAANVEQALAVITQTRSALFPQVGYSANGERVRVPETGLEALPNSPNPQSTYQALLTASWEIDLWGRIRRLSAGGAGQHARHRRSAPRRDPLARRLGRDQLPHAARTGRAARHRQQHARHLRRIRAPLPTAVQIRADLADDGLAAQSQYETAAAQIPQIESQIAQTENALSILLGRNPGPIPRGKSVYDLALPTVPAGVPSSLLERRPDLLQAEEALIAANAQIGAAKALYFPTISLTGALGSSSRDLSDLFTGPARLWNYAGQIIGPIFTFGAVSGQVAQSEAAQQAALLNYQLSIQNAFADVDNALVANQKLKDQLAAQERLVAALKDYARLAKLQYDGGYTAYSTVLQAEQTLFPAELTLASVRASVFTSAANTYKAMGGGWVTEADKQTGSATPAAAASPGLPPLF